MRIAAATSAPSSLATSARIILCASTAISGVAVLPVPMAHTGSYAITIGAAVAAVMPTDRKSVAEGKRVDVGGRRIFKKKKLKPRRLLMGAATLLATLYTNHSAHGCA